MNKAEPHRSTQRVLDILDNIVKNRESGLSLTELAAALEAPKSSLFPIVHTLCQAGFLSLHPETSRYTIGFKAYEVGNAFLKEDSINAEIKEQMRSITAQCREACFFGELVDGDVFYLFKTDSPEPIRMVASPGKRLPAYSAGIGKALLSGRGRNELEALYPDGLKPLTPNTVTDMDELYRQLEAVRQTGVAYEKEESTPYIQCIAVPIRKNGSVIAAMSVAVPVFRYDEEKERAITSLLKETQRKLETLVTSGV